MEKVDIFNILRSDRTVFSFRDIFLASKEKNSALLRRRLSYYVKQNELYHIRRGFYAKDKNYDKSELAGKIYTPSYISFETVLGQSGVTFQYYSQIFVASYLTREIVIDDQIYFYRKIKDSILTNQAGIYVRDHYYIASPERAFLDVVYISKDYHFDNLAGINWDKVYEILPIYGGNKRMAKKVKKYHEATKQGLN
ncbi:MAG: type IV toxin-antitoxin system AbiEi family antitoxin domain-containing protein [Parcubacteria group bacterium]|nr:type IV toxin-antitoxin system AbiEi family antitoxin domain-containing protein [Parcubacteria group bacterium]